MNDNQVIHDTKDVAEHFDIHTSTVRKYCDFLEKAGYSFRKNEYGHRGFFDEDLMVLRKLIELKGAMSLELASKSTVAWKNGSDVSERATTNERYSTQYSALLDEFQEFKNQQNEFNKKILERMEQRDQNLVNVLRQTLESKKEIASVSQKKWWKFWR